MLKYNDDKWIGIEDAAEYLGVNKDSIRNWIKKEWIFSPTRLESSGSSKSLNWMRG